jgi:Flp pilus assembly protein TadD
MGMHDNALPCFLKAIQLEPKGDEIAEAHAGLAAVMLAKKNFEGAIQAAKKAVDADPKNYSARLMLGAAHLARGNTEKAITELRKAVAIEGQEPEAHYMLGLAYRTARYFDFAQSEYDKLKKLDGELAAKLLQAIRTR